MTIWRRRWRLAGTTTTSQDRCPDEIPQLQATLLVVFLKVLAWLNATVGLHRYDEVHPALEAVGSRRTVQRWVARLCPEADRWQGALRIAVIERFEPRPVERMFPSGLSPPASLRCRRWQKPQAIYSLWTGLSFLVRGSVAMNCSITALLVEAQRRLETRTNIAAP